MIFLYEKPSTSHYGVGARRAAAAQAALHLAKAALQAKTAGAVAAPAVTVPKTNPAAE